MSNKRITDAWLRSGAGPMKDRRAPKGGSKNTTKDLLNEVADEHLWDIEEIIEAEEALKNDLSYYRVPKS